MADPAASGADPLSPRLNAGFEAELDQLRLQVEVMGVRVDQNLELMREFLRTGRQGLADQAVNADDDIDAMNLSLTGRCYDILARRSPVAPDSGRCVAGPCQNGRLEVLPVVERDGGVFLVG